MKRITLYFFILLISCARTVLAQTWSEPITIYEGESTNPDFSFDKNGVIHCVWVNIPSYHFGQIFYSKSMDRGETWSEPINISNNDRRASEPHIAIDSNNIIYVFYDYDANGIDATVIVMQTFDGTTWSERDTISNGSGSYNIIAMDRQNNLYCFWLQDTKMVYKILSNGIWSDVYRPYQDLEHSIIFYKAVFDNDNQLHAIGYNYIYINYSSRPHISYFKCNNNIWEDFVEFNDEALYVDELGNSIALDTSGNPSAVWGQFITRTPKRTFTSSNENGNWSTPTLIHEGEMRANSIFIDHLNTKYIVETEINPSGQFHVIYNKSPHNDSWQRDVLEQNEYSGYYSNKILEYNDTLYLVYYSHHGTAIKLRKYNVIFCDAPLKPSIFVDNFENINLSWSPPSDTIGLIGYEIYYLDEENPITVLDDSITQFTDSALEHGTYCYRIQAIYNTGCKAMCSDTLCGESVVPFGMIIGTVSDYETLLPIPEAEIVFDAEHSIVTDENGYYHITLPIGIYDTVWCSAEFYNTAGIIHCEVFTGTHPMNIRLTKQRGTVQGTVFNAQTTQPISNAVVHFSDEYSTYTNDAGVYQLLLPLGTYENVVYSAHLYEDSIIEIIEIQNNTITIDMPLQPKTAINENNSSFAVFPNPVAKTVTVSGIDVSEICVFNNFGQLMQKIKNQSVIDVSNYPSGIYLLKITDPENRNYSIKIVVQ